MTNKIRIVFSVTLFCTVVGCSSSSNNAANPEGSPANQDENNSDTSAIAGLWDFSVDEGGKQDIRYVLISADGTMTEYDYDQDDAGDGLNCYHVTTSTLIANGNNEYSQSDEIDGGFDDFMAIRNGDVLNTSYVDLHDDNENGNTSDVIMETGIALSGLDTTDFISCDTTAPPQGTYQEGDVGPSGGQVIYISTDGSIRLEAAPEGQGMATWGCTTTDIAGADRTEFGGGAVNTIEILNAGCGEDSAASLAASYRGGGNDDWFLPAFETLKRMNTKTVEADLMDGAVTPGEYWSSSESAANAAFSVLSTENSSTPGFGGVGKVHMLNVWAVREF